MDWDWEEVDDVDVVLYKYLLNGEDGVGDVAGDETLL